VILCKPTSFMDGPLLKNIYWLWKQW